MTWQCIVKVGAEGGSISLFGLLKPDGEWLYSLTRDERTLAGLNVDELQYLSKTKVVEDWDSALRLLSRYPWVQLCPLEVHQAFRTLIWDAVTNDEHARPSSMMMWERFCKKE
jgi:hypothetical protein